MEHLPPAPVAQGLKWSGQTDRGKVRPHNEDSFLGHRFDAREVHHLGKTGEATIAQADFVFAVSDGDGRRAGGRVRQPDRGGEDHAAPARSYRQSAAGLEAGFADVLAELFDQIHRALTVSGRAATRRRAGCRRP